MEQLRGAGVRYGPPVVVVVFSRQSVQLSAAKLVFRKGIVSRQPAPAVAAENIGPPQLSVPILNPPPKKKNLTGAHPAASSYLTVSVANVNTQ